MARNKKTAPAMRLGLPADYAEFLESLKERVRQAQTKAMLSANRELIALDWDIGRRIVERQEHAGWGKSVVDRLASDLQKAFPGSGGFSASNVSRMRAFYLAYARDTTISAQAVPKIAEPNVAQAVRQTPHAGPPSPLSEIPWGHNIRIGIARRTIARHDCPHPTGQESHSPIPCDEGAIQVTLHMHSLKGRSRFGAAGEFPGRSFRRVSLGDGRFAAVARRGGGGRCGDPRH